MKYQVGDLVEWNKKQDGYNYFIITGINEEEGIYYIDYLDGFKTWEPATTIFENSTKKVG